MSKKDKTPLGIFTESVGLYFSNFLQFVKYMSFPVWGQLVGLGLIFATTFLYTQNLPKLLEKYPNINNNMTILVVISVLITLPGLLIYLKAFWEYLVAYGAVNSMLDNMLKSGRVYDFEAHTGLVKKRTGSFIGLWMLVGIFSLIAVCPLFWIICGIFAVYFILAFQVFTFESQSPVGCLKRSLELILRHFASTFILMTLVGILTYYIIPQLVTKVFDGTGLTVLIAGWTVPLFSSLPKLNIPNIGTISDIQLGTIVVQSLIAQVLIQYTLPLRSILWSMWYKELSKNYEPAIKKERKPRKSKKRPSENLMEESHKKYGKKKLDTNILRRAAEKDEE